MWWIWDHPLKTSANFHGFLPLPSSVGSFFTTICCTSFMLANLANFLPLPPYECHRPKWTVPNQNCLSSFLIKICFMEYFFRHKLVIPSTRQPSARHGKAMVLATEAVIVFMHMGKVTFVKSHKCPCLLWQIWQRLILHNMVVSYIILSFVRRKDWLTRIFLIFIHDRWCNGILFPKLLTYCEETFEVECREFANFLISL